MFKIIDNCISKKNQNIIKKTMLGSSRTFPWYFASDVSYVKGKQERPAFFHNFVLGNYQLNSGFYDMVKLIAKNKNVIRCRSILQLPLEKKLIGKNYDTPHTDDDAPHLVYLYYVINADGNTLFIKNKKVIKKVKPIQGRLVIFDGSMLHTAEQPKKDIRCVINFNVDK
jgi:hypothetical protein|tara:strand:+ start:2061 stop:2567 length:507 start_codon:yes stop_codon:yes gene_type:complete